MLGNTSRKGFILLISLVLLFVNTCFVFAETETIRNITQGIEMRNSHVSIIISKQASVVSCLDVNTGIDIALHNNRPIANAKLMDGTILEADGIQLKGSSLCILFKNYKVELEVSANKDYFSIAVKTAPSVFQQLTFIDFMMDYDYYGINPFLGVGVAMSLQTDPAYYPSGESKRVIGRCYAHTGISGAKLAIVVCRKNELRSILKSVYYSLPKGAVPVSFSGGGPFALDGEANRFDCVLLGNVKPKDIPNWISFYSGFGIKQFEFLSGTSNYIQGQFSFPESGSASSFKETITDPLLSAGIISTLHTYSHFISYSANELLQNPKWQKQLEFSATFTLSNDISQGSTEIKVREDNSYLTVYDTYRSIHSPFLLIDNEIIRYKVGAGGFVSCERGQCGTRITSHKSGSLVQIIGGYYSHIAPQIGSELFYEIARRTAVAYNEGGFRGLYFDALEGIGVQLKYHGLEDYIWFYEAAFVNEVLKNCIADPLVVEYSDMYCSLWSARGRGISWDAPRRGYKNNIDDHIVRNESFSNRQYVTTLGWILFYPMKKEYPLGFSTKYMFFDDVDYLGVKSIAYDQTMTYNRLSKDEVDATPALKRNLELFATYSKLRQDRYFSDKVSAVLKEGRYEYRLENNKGTWGFREAIYCREKLRDIKEDYLFGYNPFGRQKPFIRLENSYTSLLESTIPLLAFDESKNMNLQTRQKTFSSPLDLTDNKALKISIKGNGYNSNDAVCIRLSSTSSSAYADYVIRLRFSGWRDIIVPVLDNAENSDLSFEGMEDNVIKMHQNEVDYSKISLVQVFQTANTNSVRIKEIDAVPVVSNSLTNPIVHIGPMAIVFRDTIQSGEYIEYKVGDEKALVYDSIGNSRAINVSRRGRFRIAKGSFIAWVSGTPELKNAPTEVTLTFGLYGDFIHN